MTFDIDANGILSVTAKDKGSGKSKVFLSLVFTLSDNEVEKMVKDANQMHLQTKKKREN